MKVIKKWVSRLLYPILIISLTIYLAIVNIEPGTILSGWDSLHPEFNLSLYLKRIFFGVWQSHQGVGAVASQSHAAEIPRLLVVFLLSKVFPLIYVRYAFFFLALGVGALGVYFFTKYLLSRNKLSFVKEASFLASILYVLNLTTVQQFYVPFEMFAVHFALVPWLFLYAIKLLRENGRKNLIIFSLFTLFGAAMAHTATLFYVYFAFLVLFVGMVFLLKKRKEIFKRGILIVVLTLIINSFWLLPNIYYIKNHAAEVENSKISRIFSDEAFLQGKAYGDLKSLALNENFLFNWREFNFSDNSFVYTLNEWKHHLTKPYVVEIGYSVFIAAILGLLLSLYFKSPYVISLFPLFAVSAFFWINSNPPFEPIFDYLRQSSSLFREGLRFPFTKFSIIFSFTISFYFAVFSQFLMERLKKIKLPFVYLVLAVCGLVYFAYPVFKGNLISPAMKVKIPNEYFEVFDYFDKHSQGRVAKLPLNTFWGWNYYSWGYQGAGFTWFGIPNPTFDREFDRWSRFNEDFYNEIANAFYGGDNNAFIKTLQKYQVKYLILDESVINAGGSGKILAIQKLKDLLDNSSHINKVQQFNFLDIYETDFDNTKEGIRAPKSFNKVDVDLTYAREDPIFATGDYVEDSEGIAYPFVNFDARKEPKVNINGNEISLLSSDLSFKGMKNLVTGDVLDPDIFSDVSAEVVSGKVQVKYKANGVIKESFAQDRGFSGGYNCDLYKEGSARKTVDHGKVTYFATENGVSCDFFEYQDLSYNQGYILRVKGENKEGRSLKVYLQNWGTNRMDLEELLPKGKFDKTFFILPKNEEGAGYTVNLETRSYGRVFSENIVTNIEFIPVPITYLQSIKLVPEGYSLTFNDIQILSSIKKNPTFYEVTTKGKGIITLNEGYEKGWIAFKLNGSLLKPEILTHVKANSWENGWYVPDGTNKICIVFWPQALEFLGLFAALALFVAPLVRKARRA